MQVMEQRWSRKKAVHAPQEAGAELFKRLRINLTLWYCAVLACALLLFCVGIYLSVQYLLFSPIRDSLQRQAQIMAGIWQHDPSRACTSPHSGDGPTGGRPENPGQQQPNTPQTEIIFVACFTPQGQLMEQPTGIITNPSAFTSNTSIVQNALNINKGSADDTIDASTDANGVYHGRIERHALVVRDEQGKILGVLVVGLPLTDLDRAMSTLLTALLIFGIITLLGTGLGGLLLARRALVPARLAFARQQRFIADASHELRTPLTFLCANTELLMENRSQLAPEDAELVEDIHTEATNMATLTSNMLTLARLDTDTSPGHREHDIIDLTQMARQIARQGRAYAEQKGLTLHEQSTETVRVIGDPLLLEQAIQVLLDNAIKYNHPGGTITISTSLEGKEARLEVRDTGIGIAAEHLQHLGERFYRVDKARSRATGGTGLGLAIARSIAIDHDGQLQLNSTPGQGTTAILTLPALAQSRRPVPSQAPS